MRGRRGGIPVAKMSGSHVNETAVTNKPPGSDPVRDCPVDPNGDMDDPNNLFTCLDSETCCTVDLQPACCAKKDIDQEL